MKILPAKDQIIPGVIIAVATIVVLNFVKMKWGKPAAA